MATLSTEPLATRLMRRMTLRKAALPVLPPAPPGLQADRQFIEQELIDIRDELVAIDKHSTDLSRKIARMGDSYHRRSLEVELRQLDVLAQEIQADLDKRLDNPYDEVDRDGRPLALSDRKFRRMRTRELREQLMAAAERFEGHGEHRECRQCRVDALRARHLAEYELKWRPSLRGYSYAG